MTNVKKYFCAHLRASIRPMIFILVIVLGITCLARLGTEKNVRFDYETNQMETGYRSTLYIPAFFMSILTYIIPVMEFSFFKKRINLDCVYSLPISRTAMGAVHYITGLIMLWGTFTLSYLLNFIFILIRGIENIQTPPVTDHYLLCLLLGFAIYSMMVFVFNEANTVGDGILFMILYTFVLFVVSFAGAVWISEFADIHSKGKMFLLPWGTVMEVTGACQYRAEKLGNVLFWENSKYIGVILFWVAVGIASIAIFFYKFGKKRMEKTQETSDSWFGFRILIPIYAISGMLILGWYDILMFFIIELLTLIGYTIYRRGFHYKKADIVFICSLFIFLIAGIFI